MARVRCCSRPTPRDVGIRHSVCHTDGAGADVIQVPGGGSMLPVAKIINPQDAFFRMHGRQVYDFAVSRGPEVIREVVDAAGADLGSVSMIIPHQANLNILRELASRLALDPSRFFQMLDRVGNTAAASVPIALHEAITTGAVKTGDRVVLVAFGGGLSWGAVLMDL